ncbi:hypothetical protein ACFIOY_26430 [Bradyrhizobium sp. TZ2]
MITAKGLKPTSQSQSQPSRADFVEPEQQKRRFVPLAFPAVSDGMRRLSEKFFAGQDGSP